MADNIIKNCSEGTPIHALWELFIQKNRVKVCCWHHKFCQLLSLSKNFEYHVFELSKSLYDRSKLWSSCSINPHNALLSSFLRPKLFWDLHAHLPFSAAHTPESALLEKIILCYIKDMKWKYKLDTVKSKPFLIIELDGNSERSMNNDRFTRKHLLNFLVQHCSTQANTISHLLTAARTHQRSNIPISTVTHSNEVRAGKKLRDLFLTVLCNKVSQVHELMESDSSTSTITNRYIYSYYKSLKTFGHGKRREVSKRHNAVASGSL